MAQTNVSNCIFSIIGSFTSGLDVFKRFRELRDSDRKIRKNKNSSKREAEAEEQELQLARSLRRGPEDIGREYQRNVQCVGDEYAMGDGMRIVLWYIVVVSS